MRRYVPLLIAGTVLIAAACNSDTTIAPQRSTSAISLFSRPAARASLTSEDKTYTFTLDPNGGAVKIGNFRIDYPANAVCDPATSGYGADYWMADCETLTAPITMTAHVSFNDDQALVDFSPDIRFAPSANVYISVKRPKIKGQPLTDELKAAYAFLYFHSVDGAKYSVDEAATDGEMATKYDNSQGWIWRRIRHFSGYYVRSGEPCDDTAGDPDCVGTSLF